MILIGSVPESNAFRTASLRFTAGFDLGLS